MKKVIKFVPVVTIVLAIVNIVVTIVDFKSAGEFGSDPNGFGLGDIICNFSHVGWWHLQINLIVLLMTGTIIEVLLSIRNKRILYVAIIVASIVGHIIMSEFINKYGIGASGWLSSLPIVAIPVIVWFAGTAKYYRSEFEHPVWVALALPVLQTIVGINWDLSSLNSGDGIGHDAHLAGYGFGAVLFLVAAPFAIRAWVRTFACARAQKHSIAVRRAEFLRNMKAQQHIVA